MITRKAGLSKALAVVALSLVAAMSENASAPAAAFSPGVANPDEAFGYFSIPMVAGNGANPEVFVRIVDALGNGLGWVYFGGLTDYTESGAEIAARRLARPIPFRPVVSAPQTSSTRIVNVAKSGDQFTDSVSGNGTTTIHIGDSVQWMFLDSTSHHSTTSGTCTQSTDPYTGYGMYDCAPDGKWDSTEKSAGDTFTRQFTTAGSYKYYCSVHLYMMTGLIQVNP